MKKQKTFYSSICSSYSIPLIVLITLLSGCSKQDKVSSTEPLPSSLDQGVMSEGGSEVMNGGEESVSLDMEVDMELDMEVDMEADMEDLRPLIDPEYIMNEIQFLDSTQGFDLTGDGVPNNGLALLFEDPAIGPVLGGNPNEYVARIVRKGKLILLLDFKHFQDFTQDGHVEIEMLLGTDTDGRRANNFNGSEFFVTCSSLTEDGQADSQFNQAQITDGALQGHPGEFRFIVTFSRTEVVLRQAHITAQFSPDGQEINEGRLGGAVSFSDLEEVVYNDPEIGSGFARIMLTFLSNKLDVDLDGDGTLDALSAAFRFKAVPAIIDRESPCTESEF